MDFLQIIQFASIVKDLPHNRHLGFMQRTVGRAEEQLGKDFPDGCPANLAASIIALRRCVTQEDLAFKKQLGSDYTPQIKVADEVRGNTFLGIRTLCEAYLRIGTDEQKAGSAVILKYMTLYKVSPNDSYEDEGVKLQQLCDDSVKIYDFADAVTKCGLTSLFAKLSAQNETCRDLINRRTLEQSDIDKQAMNKARAQTDEAYALFVTILNAYVVVEFEDGYSRFNQAVIAINADIEYFRQRVLRKTNRSSGDDEKPDGDDDKGDDVPEEGEKGDLTS